MFRNLARRGGSDTVWCGSNSRRSALQVNVHGFWVMLVPRVGKAPRAMSKAIVGNRQFPRPARPANPPACRRPDRQAGGSGGIPLHHGPGTKRPGHRVRGCARQFRGKSCGEGVISATWLEPGLRGWWVLFGCGNQNGRGTRGAGSINGSFGRSRTHESSGCRLTAAARTWDKTVPGPAPGHAQAAAVWGRDAVVRHRRHRRLVRRCLWQLGERAGICGFGGTLSSLLMVQNRSIDRPCGKKRTCAFKCIFFRRDARDSMLEGHSLMQRGTGWLCCSRLRESLRGSCVSGLCAASLQTVPAAGSLCAPSRSLHFLAPVLSFVLEFPVVNLGKPQLEPALWLCTKCDANIPRCFGGLQLQAAVNPVWVDHGLLLVLSLGLPTRDLSQMTDRSQRVLAVALKSGLGRPHRTTLLAHLMALFSIKETV